MHRSKNGAHSGRSSMFIFKFSYIIPYLPVALFATWFDFRIRIVMFFAHVAATVLPKNKEDCLVGTVSTYELPIQMFVTEYRFASYFCVWFIYFLRWILFYFFNRQRCETKVIFCWIQIKLIQLKPAILPSRSPYTLGNEYGATDWIENRGRLIASSCQKSLQNPV